MISVISVVDVLKESVGADPVRDSGGEFNRAQGALLHPGETPALTDIDALKESVGADLVRDSDGQFIHAYLSKAATRGITSTCMPSI